jgi:hypothetical protein
MWINFARALKIYHNVDFRGILGIVLGSERKWRWIEFRVIGFDRI